jgi:hypothetical protein
MISRRLSVRRLRPKASPVRTVGRRWFATYCPADLGVSQSNAGFLTAQPPQLPLLRRTKTAQAAASGSREQRGRNADYCRLSSKRNSSSTFFWLVY